MHSVLFAVETLGSSFAWFRHESSGSKSALALVELALQHRYIAPDVISTSHPQHIYIISAIDLTTAFYSTNFEISTQSTNLKLQLIQNIACS